MFFDIAKTTFSERRNLSAHFSMENFDCVTENKKQRNADALRD